MNALKKLTAASALLMSLGLGLANQAQAVVFYNGTSTIADWATDSPVTDADNDAIWTWISNSAAINNARISLSEVELGGIDFYTAAFDFTPLTAGGLTAGTYNLKYSVSLTEERFLTAGLDSTIVGDHPPDSLVTKNIYSDAAMTNLLATITSVSGDNVGPIALSGQTIYIEEIFTVPENVLLTETANDFSTGVPEPGTMLLLGASLIGLAARRRKLHQCV